MNGLLNYCELKKSLEKSFADAGVVETADIDWIICEVTKKKRSTLPFCGDFSKDELSQIMEMVKKRLNHIPLDYILGYSTFFGRRFKVDRNVLIPRIDTEVLIETILKETKSEKELSFLDIGTGSGILAITIQKETGFKAYAVDVCKEALDVAKLNAKTNNSNIEFVLSDLFDQIKNLKVDFIVSNPPYIETGEISNLEKEVKDFEPILALDGGKDGLNFYRKIINEAKQHLNKNGEIFFEIGFNQADAVVKLMENDFCEVKVVKDYGGNDRVVYGKLK